MTIASRTNAFKSEEQQRLEAEGCKLIATENLLVDTTFTDGHVRNMPRAYPKTDYEIALEYSRITGDGRKIFLADAYDGSGNPRKGHKVVYVKDEQQNYEENAAPKPKSITKLDIALAISPIPILGEKKAFNLVYNTNLDELVKEGKPFTEADIVKRAKNDTLKTRSLLYVIEPVFFYAVCKALISFSEAFK